MLSVFARLIGSKTPTSTLTPTDTLTFTPTPTFTSTVTLTPSTATSTDTSTVSLTPTSTATPTNTSTSTATPTDTSTASLTPTSTATPTDTSTASLTPTSTATSTDTSTSTATSTDTSTSTATSTDTSTSTATSTDTSTSTATSTDTSTSTATSTDTPCGYGSCAHYRACYILDNSECFFDQTSFKCPAFGEELDFYLTVNENSLAPTFASYSNLCFYLHEEFVPISECGKSAGRYPYDATHCGGTSFSFLNETEYSNRLFTDISELFDYEHSSCESCCGCITPTVTQYIHPPTATNYNIEYPPTPTPTIISNCDHCKNLDPDVICPPRPTLTPKETFISALSTNPIFVFYENNCYYKTENEYDLNRVYNPMGQDNCDSCYSLNFYRL